MKNATLCAIFGAGLSLASKIAAFATNHWLNGAIESGDGDAKQTIELCRSLFTVFNIADLIGCALVVFFFVSLYRKQ